MQLKHKLSAVAVHAHGTRSASSAKPLLHLLALVICKAESENCQELMCMNTELISCPL